MLDARADASYLPGLSKYVSFVDEAGHGQDPNQHYLCLAGLLTTESAWTRLDSEWRDACVAEGLSETFHIMEIAGRRGQFAGWPEERRRNFLRILISIIYRAGALPIGSVVSLEGYNALASRFKQGFKDPHFLAFQTLTYQIAVAASLRWEPGPVTMVYAHHPEHSQGLVNTASLWEAVRKHNSIVALFMESYRCGEPKEHSGLQAADLWAYELRHHFEVIRPSGRKPRWPFLRLAWVGLNYTQAHDFISYHDEYGLSGIGRMSQVQRLGEINLFKPGYIGLHPAKARELDLALRKFADTVGGGQSAEI